MQVYKAFFRIIQKNLLQIIIYVFVFLAVSISLTIAGVNPVQTEFTQTKISMAFFDYDNSSLSLGLKNHLAKTGRMADLADEAESIQDALFFREIEYALRVPQGFAEALMSGEEAYIEKISVPASVSEVYLDNAVNKYLNTARIYISNTEGLSQEELADYIAADMEKSAKVEVNREIEELTLSQKAGNHYNYMAYSLFAVLILGVSSVMLVFQSQDLKNRNLCSPITLRNMNFQLILGNISYAVLAWMVMNLPSIFMFGSFMFTAKGLLLMANSLIFTMAALSISFLISILVTSPGAVSAAANVISLGSSFISGVFVPQELLSDTVLRISSFTPAYWYVKSNNDIAGMGEVTAMSRAPIFNNMLIILGFAAASFTIALVITKQRRIKKQ